MSRKLRFEYEDAMNQLINRSHGRVWVFRNEKNKDVLEARWFHTRAEFQQACRESRHDPLGSTSVGMGYDPVFSRRNDSAAREKRDLVNLLG